MHIYIEDFPQINYNKNVFSLSVTAKETSIHLLYNTLRALRTYGFLSLHWYMQVTSQMCQQLRTVHMGRCDESTFIVSQKVEQATVDTKQFLVWLYQLMTYQFTAV